MPTRATGTARWSLMAGLAPGVTGVLAAGTVELLAPTVERVVVAARQGPTGTAGERGTRDLLDLLTGADVAYRDRPVQAASGATTRTPLFDLPNAESEVSELGTALELATGFGHADRPSRVTRSARASAARSAGL